MWAPALNPKGLSQGDILANTPVGTAIVPVTYLGRNTWPKHDKASGTSKPYWPQELTMQLFPGDDTGLFIARGRMTRVVVVMHHCEMDDKPDAGRVVVAPIAPIERVTQEASRARIMAGGRRAFLPLPALPGLGDHYADLRSMASVDRKLLTDAQREFSMDGGGLVALRAQLIDFFTRLEIPELKEGLDAGLSAE